MPLNVTALGKQAYPYKRYIGVSNVAELKAWWGKIFKSRMTAILIMFKTKDFLYTEIFL